MLAIQRLREENRKNINQAQKKKQSEHHGPERNSDGFEHNEKLRASAEKSCHPRHSRQAEKTQHPKKARTAHGGADGCNNDGKDPSLKHHQANQQRVEAKPRIFKAVSLEPEGAKPKAQLHAKVDAKEVLHYDENWFGVQQCGRLVQIRIDPNPNGIDCYHEQGQVLKTAGASNPLATTCLPVELGHVVSLFAQILLQRPFEGISIRESCSLRCRIPAD
mmetsp:Transcript_19098/g.42175  ORF Transcript_19098/g.42175 Transcript_19098/m.42175 type:complete len:219 (+) Transcript_19098:843-1499(+)